jgi:hypothetical protein
MNSSSALRNSSSADSCEPYDTNSYDPWTPASHTSLSSLTRGYFLPSRRHLQPLSSAGSGGRSCPMRAVARYYTGCTLPDALQHAATIQSRCLASALAAAWAARAVAVRFLAARFLAAWFLPLARPPSLPARTLDSCDPALPPSLPARCKSSRLGDLATWRGPVRPLLLRHSRQWRPLRRAAVREPRGPAAPSYAAQSTFPDSQWAGRPRRAKGRRPATRRPAPHPCAATEPEPIPQHGA